MKIHLCLLLSLCLLSAQGMAQAVAQRDSVPSTKEEKNRNVLLNASSANEPRRISIGLPATFTSDIFEDGVPVSHLYWPDLPYYSWQQSVSMEGQSLLSLSEGALQFGVCNYIVSSRTRLTADKTTVKAKYTANLFGRQVVDANIAGPIARGWGYSVSSFQNFDPGSNHLDASDLQNRMQIYKGALSKRWDDNRGEVSALYQYARYTKMSDNAAPFYYNGEDGSVDTFEGFNMGRDQYLPNYSTFHYADINTGREVDENIKPLNTITNHQLTFGLNYRFKNGMQLTAHSKLKKGEVSGVGFSAAGLFAVTAADGYSYADGTPYSGYVQNRYLLHPVGFERSFANTVELTGKDERHSWRLGRNEWYNRSGVKMYTGIYSHEAKENPKALLNGGRQVTAPNQGGEFYDAHENKLALFASDDWTVTQRWWLSLGLRLEWDAQRIKNAAAFDVDGNVIEEANKRYEGFSLDKTRRMQFNNNWFNPSFTLNTRYTLRQGFGMMGEYVHVRQHVDLQDYAGVYLPCENPVDVNMARAGLFWNNSWVQLVSQVSFISQSNYKNREQFTNPQKPSETLTLPILYDVATWGWTTDAVLTPFKGFSFHGLLTLQNPLFKNFSFQPIFSTGVGEKYDFSDKNVTAMSKLILEMDPSFQWNRWRWWLSFRYQSKQYINRTNTLYFKGRWETFGGIDYKMNDHISFSLSLVNILNQKGVSGSIKAADLATDVSAYQHHYLMSGSFIRPFTAEFSTSIDF